MRVSVVVPSFRQVEFLGDTLASVFGQGYPDVEVLVLDGGSDDGSVEVIEAYADRLAYWRSHPDAGQAAAINEGMARATGDVLCWLNSDDVHLPWTMRAAVEALTPHAGRPALIYGGAAVFREGAALETSPRPAVPFDRQRLGYDDYIVQPSALWTRQLWDAVGPLREDLSYTFDWDWWLRAAAVTELRPVPRLLSMYRVHGGHKTGTGGGSRRDEIVALVRERSTPFWADLYAGVAAAMDRHPEVVSGKYGHGRRQQVMLLAHESGRRWAATAARRPAAYRTAFSVLHG